MSITDADLSAPLDLAWTENTVVLFTAGSLAAVANLVSEVESKLKRGTLSTSTVPLLADVQRWLARAKQELMEVRRYTWGRRYAYASTTAGTYRYALPPDFNGLISLKDTTNDREIKVWPEYWVDNMYPDASAESNDEPTIATIKNMELWLIPPPSGVFTLQLEYDRSGADGTTTDFSYLPEIERFRCCEFALWHAFASVHNWDAANYYKVLWQEGLGKSAKADSKRKWRGKRYQAISILQENTGYYTQQD